MKQTKTSTNPMIGTGLKTLSKIKDGMDAPALCYLELTNDSHTVPHLEDGSGGNYVGCETIANFYIGNAIETGSEVTYTIEEDSVIGQWIPQQRKYIVTEMIDNVAHVDIKATYNNEEYLARFSLCKVFNGKDSYSMNLTNDTHTFSADYNGVLSSNITTTTEVMLYKGTELVAFDRIALPTEKPPGLQWSVSGSTITFTALEGSDLPLGGEIEVSAIVGSKRYKKSFHYLKIREGRPGLDGSDGVAGQDGVSIIWKGSFPSHPPNPQNGWAYYNSTDKKSYVFQSNTWYQMTIDGNDGEDGNKGEDGLSIEFKGEMKDPPSNPIKNWTYKDTDNGIVYIYTGSAWEVLTYDGTDGVDGTNGTNGTNGADGADGTNGADGANGLSVFITYHDSTSTPAKPTGNGTSGGWHTNSTPTVIWMSQKISANSTSGDWGEPIKIKGETGSTGGTGPTGPQGPAGPILDWVQDWDGKKVTIGNTQIVTPRIFAGTMSNNKPTGVALGKDIFGTLSGYSGVTGLAGYNNGIKTFHIKSDGSATFGKDGDSQITIATNGTISIPAAKITGKLTANQIDATNLRVSSANITGTITADAIVGNSITASHIKGGHLEGTSVTSSTYGYNRATLAEDGLRFYPGNSYTTAGRISYDSHGTGDDAPNRLWIRSLGDYALKIQSGTNMSLSANEGWNNIYLKAKVTSITGDLTVSGNIAAKTIVAVFG